MKLCSKCRIIQEYSFFTKNNRSKDKLSSHCKNCQKSYRIPNRKKMAEYGKEYRIKTKATRPSRVEYNKNWRIQNKIRKRESDNQYQKNKYNTNPIFKLKSLLRSRIRAALKNNQKQGSILQLLGCSIEQFKSYIEGQFKEGMSWDNHGYRGWHLDHKMPISKFDLSKKDELSQACHYTNFQPLWAEENFLKRDKIL